MSQDKDEIVKMAREAGAAPEDGVNGFWVAQTEDLQRLIALARAPLVAENERLKKITWEPPFHNGNSAEHWNKVAVMRYQENCALKAELAALRGSGEAVAYTDPDCFSRQDEIIRKLAKENAELDNQLTQALQERDKYHDVADALANGVALHFDADIGEHSNMNDPWQNALDFLEGGECAEVVRPQPSAVPVVEQMVAGFKRTIYAMEFYQWNWRTSDLMKRDACKDAMAAIAAGQKYLKENGK